MRRLVRVTTPSPSLVMEEDARFDGNRCFPGLVVMVQWTERVGVFGWLTPQGTRRKEGRKELVVVVWYVTEWRGVFGHDGMSVR